MKTPIEQVRIHTLQDVVNLREPAWLWDCAQGRILWANNAGLSFWGEHDLTRLKRKTFDRSMPALARLTFLAGQELPEDGFVEEFLFWTGKGAKTVECKCTHISTPEGISGLLLTAIPKDEVQEFEGFEHWDIQPYSPETSVDTTFENSLSSPEDQETLKEIAKLLSDPGASEEAEEDDEPDLDDEEQDSQTQSGQEASEKRTESKPNGLYRGERKNDPQKNSAFFAKVSHEVRTPLNSIIGFAELMKEERFGAIGNQKYKCYIEDIHESARHALSLINDLLDISKVESGRFQVHPVPIDLNTTIEHCISSLQPQTGQARLVIRQSLSKEIRKIQFDQRNLRQVILNLLSNAIKFTSAGGQIIISTQRENENRVRLRVRDTGIGMSESDLRAALQPFNQLETATNGPSGTGLGLPLTKALVEANHSEFRITSTEGKGTLVEILFPMQ